jgi:hypothetical protein
LVISLLTIYQSSKMRHLKLKMNKKDVRVLKSFFVVLLVLVWILTSYPAVSIPGFGIFPPEIQEVDAAACTTATLATGTDPGAATIAPGSGIAERGQFTVTGSGTTCSATVTALTVTLAGAGTPYVGLAEVRITNSAGDVTYYSAVTSFSSNDVSFSGGTAIPIAKASVGAVTYKIQVTPFVHTSMPPVPGASYAITPYVSAWTTPLTESGSDTNPNTTTIDNASPTSATVPLTSTAGTENNTLKWTSSAATDFQTTSGSIILRWAAATPGAEVPAEGSTYTAGNTITSATVACVISSAASAAVSKIDGTGGDTGCTTAALTSGQQYSYKVFSLDLRGNYDAGTTLNGSPLTPKGTTTLSTSSDPAPATVAPGSGIRSAGQFALTTSTGSDTVTALTLTLAGSPAGSYAAIDSVSIRDTSCAGTLYFSAVAPSSDSVSFSGGTALAASTGGNTYLICVTPKDHTLAAGTYSVSPYSSTTWTSSNGNTRVTTDANSNALTIDNTAPSGATLTSGSAGVGNVTLNWTTSSSGDFDTTNGSVILRWTSGSAGSEVPAEGNSSYVAGDSIAPSATVACVISSNSSTALSKVNGTGGSSGCTTSALTPGQQYTYVVFQRDQYGNYDAGVSIGTFTPTSASSTFTQNKYLWYEDNDLADPTSVWGTPDLLENQAIVVIPPGNDPPDATQELRLRVNMVVNTANLLVSTKYFKLEYKAATDGSCVSGSWTDVDTGNAWAYAGSTVADGADIVKVLSDTTTGKGEEYVKSKGSGTSLNHVAANSTEIIEYDFHIVGTSSIANSQYSFRVVETNAGGTSETVFDGYTNCPTLTTEPGTQNLLRHGNVFTEEIEKGFFWAN